MAKGQYLSSYQQGIVKRFYEHRDSVLWQRLAELVSDIYVTTSEKALAKLWKSARETLVKAGVDAAGADAIANERRVQDLAAVVGALAASPPRARKTGPQATHDDDL